jgi:hypothetical protein
MFDERDALEHYAPRQGDGLARVHEDSPLAAVPGRPARAPRGVAGGRTIRRAVSRAVD